MEEQPVDIPCPICKKEGDLKMVAHVSEIPYFGEHTQVTVLCHACGWRQTDFIPAEGKKAGGWSLVIKDVEQLKSRVVRSSSCTVKLLELDLQVNPGSSATGYVSNVEGVLNRFLEVVNMVLNDLKSDFVEKQNETDEDEISSLIKDIEKLEAMIESIDNVGTSKSESLTLEFLDPHGNSMIIDSNATERELSEDELEALPVGPEPAVFSKNEL
jgi:zinc finger protein